MEFSRLEFWSELPFSSLGDLFNPGTEPRSSALQADSLWCEPPGKPKKKPGLKLLLLLFRDIRGLLGRGLTVLQQNILSGSNTSPCLADGSRQGLSATFTPQGRRLPFTGGIDIRLAHQVSRKIGIKK